MSNYSTETWSHLNGTHGSSSCKKFSCFVEVGNPCRRKGLYSYKNVNMSFFSHFQIYANIVDISQAVVAMFVYDEASYLLLYICLAVLSGM